MLYAFFWMIPRRLKFICRRFGTLCLFHLHTQEGAWRMNSAEGMLGYYTGSGLAWKWSEPLGSDHLVGFITNKFVTMHGHMNVKWPIETIYRATNSLNKI